MYHICQTTAPYTTPNVTLDWKNLLEPQSKEEKKIEELERRIAELEKKQKLTKKIEELERKLKRLESGN